MTEAQQAAMLVVGPLVVVAALVLSAAMIVASMPILRRYALARPNARSSHGEPTPQGGGIAVCAAMIASTTMTAFGAPQLGIAFRPDLAPPLAASVLVGLIGMLDDIRPIGAMPRMLLQTAAVAVVIATLPADLRVIRELPWGAERGLLLIGGLWFVNLVNFMDGIDWMTVAEVVPVTAGLVLLGFLGALPAPGIVLALALLGATIGFAPFNRPVARLFLGDVGSLPIGLVLGWLLVQVAGSGHLVAALLLPLYYLADSTLTLLRRLLGGERIWEAHRTHFYQKATDRGLTVLEIVGRVMAVNIALAILAAVTVAARNSAISLAALACGTVLVALLLAGFARGRR